MLLGIVVGIFLGAVAWHIGLLIADAMRRRGGCYRHCEKCGEPYDYPLTFVLKRKGYEDLRYTRGLPMVYYR